MPKAAALSALGAALPFASEGAVVYSGWLNLEVPFGGNLIVGLQKDGHDFGSIGLSVDSSPVTSFPRATFRQFVFPRRQPGATQGINLLDNSGGYAIRFWGPGDTIIVDPAFGLTVNGTDYSFFSTTIGGGPRYRRHPQVFGFQSATGQLGWVRTEVILEPTGAAYRLLDWGAETEPGSGITVPPIPEPTPSGLVALALGAASIVRRRRNP